MTYEAALSFLDGVVLSTGFEKSWGKFIWVMALDKIHKVIFAHLSEIKVKKGQQVEVGDVLGISGATGSTWRADGSKEPFPHLHFGLQELVRGVWSWVDPGPHFAARPPGGPWKGFVDPLPYLDGVAEPSSIYTPLLAGEAKTLANLALRETPSKNGMIHARIEPGEVINIYSSTVVADGITWRCCSYHRVCWIGEHEGGNIYLEQVK